jgi:hypothetical protein
MRVLDKQGVGRKETRDNNDGVIMAMESPLLVREVSFSLLQLALLNRPRTDQHSGTKPKVRVLICPIKNIR